jgi:hypothetical protein
MKCLYCHGTKTLYHDIDYDKDIPCNYCNGTGEVPMSQEDKESLWTAFWILVIVFFCVFATLGG